MKQSYKDIILEYIKDNPGESRTAIADLILADGVITDKSHRTLRRYIGQLMNQKAATPLDNDDSQDDNHIVADEDISWDIVESNGEKFYSITYSKEHLLIPTHTVDKLFCAYSRKGLNYNKPQILATMNVERKVFDALVSNY